jgi:predicted GNAT superfamily acetyltransferase
MIIKPITTAKDARQVVQVEAATWEMDLASAMPVHILMAVAENGGLLLGAYKGEKLIGFTLGWLGTVGNSPKPADRQLKLVSHLTGVLPGFRDLRVGYQLKLAQRKWAIERGLGLITWTFDPLESRNANLNMRRLGCICQIYLEDFYGEMDDQVSVGIESDRFQVEWWINSERVKERLTPSADSGPRLQDAQLLNPATLGPDGHPRPAEQPAELIGARLLVEIPSDMQAIRRTDLALGIAWRHHTRALFESAFAAGYRVADFIFERDSSPPRSFYLLEQMDADEADRCRRGS